MYMWLLGRDQRLQLGEEKQSSENEHKRKVPKKRNFPETHFPNISRPAAGSVGPTAAYITMWGAARTALGHHRRRGGPGAAP